MNTIQNILEKKDNIIIIGPVGCGKGVVLKSILTNLVSTNKKVLVLEPLGEKEYKQTTVSLGGNYLVYENTSSIDYSSKLTTISFSTESSRPKIELILSIIKDAENSGVEVILIDEAWDYLKECEKLITNIHVQLIVNTQFDTEILSEENSKNFKELFKVLFLMGQDYYNIHYTYPQLLSLYNVNKSVIEDLKAQQCYESIIIQYKEVIENSFKVKL